MGNNKKALGAESRNYANDIVFSNFIIPEKLNKETVMQNMPVVLNDIMSLFQQKHVNISFNCILNVLLTKTAQMITAKRVTFKEVDNVLIPNWYSIIFMPSGGGKDRLSKDLDNSIFSDFRQWFKTSADNYKLNEENKINRIANEKYPDYKSEKQKQMFINTEKEKIRNVVIEMQNGTQEGFYSDAKAFDKANFGSLFLKISEFGLYLKSINTEKEMFLDCLYNAYDGKVISKCIKGSNREPDIENLPVNILLYSDYTLFKADIKGLFNTLMATGLNRRSVISFRPITDRIAPRFTYEQKHLFSSTAEKIKNNLYNIFNRINQRACYQLLETTNDNVLNPYVQYLNDLYNKTDDLILKSEIESREIKSLKLSCLYACLNHPEDLNIYETDLKQAIMTIQLLSKDLEAFNNYKPRKNDKYDLLYNSLKSNIDKQYTKTEMKRLLMSLGWTRRNAYKDFDEIVEYIKEIAGNDNYSFIEQQINNNSGTKYFLQQINPSINDDKIIPLPNLLMVNAENLANPNK